MRVPGKKINPSTTISIVQRLPGVHAQMNVNTGGRQSLNVCNFQTWCERGKILKYWKIEIGERAGKVHLFQTFLMD